MILSESSPATGREEEGETRLGDVSVVIPAAGASLRMGGEVHKPLLTLGKEPILIRTCRRLSSVPGVFEIIVVAHPEDLDFLQGEAWPALEAAGVTLVVAGGKSRADSVWRGIEVVAARAQLIAVHDAVRPFVSDDIVRGLIDIARKRGAAVPVIPMADTPKRMEGDTITETVRRIGLVRVQTPQVFQAELLIEAYEYAMHTGELSESITDDAQLVEKLGRGVAAVLGDECNLKITSPRDMRIAEAYLAAGLVT